MKFIELRDCVVEPTPKPCPHCNWFLLSISPKNSHPNIDHFYACMNDDCGFIGSSKCSIVSSFKNMMSDNKIKIVDFQIDKSFGQGPLDVTFTETCLNITQPSNWTWDFGDGNSPIESPTGTCTYTFQTPGTYTVKMTIFESAVGNHSITKQNIIHIS